MALDRFLFSPPKVFGSILIKILHYTVLEINVMSPYQLEVSSLWRWTLLPSVEICPLWALEVSHNWTFPCFLGFESVEYYIYTI